MQESLAALETKLNEVLVKKAPFQIPAGGRKFLAEIAWVLALIGAILGTIGAFGIFGVLGIFGGLVVLGGGGLALTLAWVSLAVLVAQVVLEAMAISPLKDLKKRGWDLMYYSMLLSAAYTVVDLIYNLSRGGVFAGAAAITGFIWSAAVTVATFYVLFQVRGNFMGKAAGHKSADAPKS